MIDDDDAGAKVASDKAKIAGSPTPQKDPSSVVATRALALFEDGQYQKTVVFVEDALAHVKATQGPWHEDEVALLQLLGAAHHKMGRYETSTALFRDCYERLAPMDVPVQERGKLSEKVLSRLLASREAVSPVLLAIADNAFRQRRYADARRQGLSVLADLTAQRPGPRPGPGQEQGVEPEVATAAAVGAAQLRVARAAAALGRLSEAFSLSAAGYVAVVRASPPGAAAVADACYLRATVLLAAGDPRGAAELHKEAYRVRRALVWPIKKRRRHPMLADCLLGVAAAYLQQGKHYRALRKVVVGQTLRVEIFPAGHWALLEAAYLHASALLACGCAPAALEEHLEVLRARLAPPPAAGDGHAPAPAPATAHAPDSAPAPAPVTARDDVSDSLTAAARCYLALGQPHLAERLLSEALAVLRAAFGDLQGDYAHAHAPTQAHAHAQAQAQAPIQAPIQAQAHAHSVGDDHPKILDVLQGLAEAHRLVGAYPAALALLDEVLVRGRRALGFARNANHPWLLATQRARAEVMSDAGDVRGALD